MQKWKTNNKTSQLTVWASILIPLLIATFFRFWRFYSQPPGLSGDEASFGLISLRILEGHFFQVSEFGTLISYVATPFILLLGRTSLALRLPGEIAGVATTGIVYFIVNMINRDRLEAFFAATIYAFTFTFVHFSRLAFPTALLPLIQVLIYYFFLKAWQYRRLKDFFLSGLFTGIVIHTYQSALAFPLLMGIIWIVWGRRKRQVLIYPAIAFWGGFLIFALPYIIEVASTAVYFHSDRYVGTFIFNPNIHQGHLFTLILHQLQIHVGMYGWIGDPVWRHNVPGRPLFDPVMSAFFFLGTLKLVHGIRRPINQFLLVNYAILLLPAFLSYEPNGAIWTHISALFIPGTIFAASGLAVMVRFFRKMSSLLGTIALIMTFLFLVVEGIWSYHIYFQIWTSNVLSTMSFDELFVRTAYQLNNESSNPDIWLIPKAASEHNQIVPFSFSFLYTNVTPFFFIPADEETAPKELTKLANGLSRIGLVTWSSEALGWAAPIYQDNRGLIQLLLQKNGTKRTLTKTNGLTLDIFELSPFPNFSLPTALTSSSWKYGDQIQLSNVSFGTFDQDSLDDSGDGWMGGHWQILRTLQEDYKVTLRILDRNGYQLSQTDQILLDPHGAATGDWQPRTPTWNHIFFSLPAGTPPGDYIIAAGLYDADTTTLLPIVAGDRWSARMARIGNLHVKKIVQPHHVEPDFAITNYRGQTAILIGYNAFPTRIISGDVVGIPLAWQAKTNWHRPGDILFRLIDMVDRTPVQETTMPFAPFVETYPWQAEEIILQVYPLRIQRNIDAGRYLLQVAIQNPLGQQTEPWIDLTTVQIVSWPRRFTAPTIKNVTNIEFDNKIKLYGYEIVSQNAYPTIRIKLCWQVLSEMETSYKLFVQLLNDQNHAIAQIDTVPGEGSQPTSTWQTGEYICNSLMLTPQQKLPAGNYTIITGFYDPKFERRLIARDPRNGSENDRAVLASFSLD